MDEKNLFNWDEMFENKKGMIEPSCKLFHEWKMAGMAVTHLHMDNAGENLKLIERLRSADWKMGISKFELTTRNTPQQNSIVEVGFGHSIIEVEQWCIEQIFHQISKI